MFQNLKCMRISTGGYLNHFIHGLRLWFYLQLALFRFVVLEYYLYLNVMIQRLSFLERAKVYYGVFTIWFQIIQIFLVCWSQFSPNLYECCQGLRINVFTSCYELSSMHLMANVSLEEWVLNSIKLLLAITLKWQFWRWLMCLVKPCLTFWSSHPNFRKVPFNLWSPPEASYIQLCSRWVQMLSSGWIKAIRKFQTLCWTH